MAPTQGRHANLSRILYFLQLEIIILSEISQKEKDKYHDIIYMWNLKYDTALSAGGSGGPVHEERPRATPCPKSGTAAQSARLRRHRNGQQEPPRVRGQGRWPEGATQRPRPVVARRRHSTSEVRGCQEKPPCARGQGR